jgi:hypothetical protein
MAKDKPFRDALRMQIADAGEDHKALRRIALALMEKAACGDVQAIKEIADRLDGKVPQGHGQDEELGPIQTTIVTGVPRKGDDDETND